MKARTARKLAFQKWQRWYFKTSFLTSPEFTYFLIKAVKHFCRKKITP